MTVISNAIINYNAELTGADQVICNMLANEINKNLPEAENKIWHGHPVWFLEGNPIVGYSKENLVIRLMFWSGADFEEDQLHIVGKKFKDASIYYRTVEEIDAIALERWLEKSKTIQWDYKNIVKRKGKLERIK